MVSHLRTMTSTLSKTTPAVLSWRRVRNVVVLSLIVTLFFPMGNAALSGNISINNSGTILYDALSPLHVEGPYIKNIFGQVVTLRGVDYSYFCDDPRGSWITRAGFVVWNSFDTIVMGDNLDAMRSWGANIVRTPITIEWWTKNTYNFRSNIATWIVMAARRGMYVEIVPWRVSNATSFPELPYPPYNNGDPDTAIIGSVSAWVTFWADMANTLKAYPSVLFELQNEPHGNATAKTSYFNAAQQVITAIRNTGSTNPIVFQWDYGVGADIGNAWTNDMSWVTDNPLTDTTGNLIYSTHIYRNSFVDSRTPFHQLYTFDEMTDALNVTGVLSVAAQHPVYVGEIGCSLWSSDQSNEQAWYNNTLSIFNQYAVSFSAWWWWSIGNQWGLYYSGAQLVPDYKPNQAGLILQSKLSQ